LPKNKYIVVQRKKKRGVRRGGGAAIADRVVESGGAI